MKRIQLFWKSAFLCVLIYLIVSPLFAAVGCDLNDPDRDVKRLFPESTGYKTLYVSIAQKGGEALLREVEARLGDHFQGLYETVDVPYTMYQVFSGKELIGYIHGVNQKGQYGGIQVFLALDLEGTIRAFYFQKLTSQYAKSLRDIRFGEQFVGLSLKDFYEYDIVNHQAAGDGRVARIQNPAPEAESDFLAALRAAKKNLILVDEFLLGNRHLRYFQEKRADGSIALYGTHDLGMEKRPRRFSLTEAFFEGSRTDGREDCLSMLRSDKDEKTGNNQRPEAQVDHAEFRSAEKKASGTASRT